MEDETTKRKSKPNYPLKVHVWGESVDMVATKICIFVRLKRGRK